MSYCIAFFPLAAKRITIGISLLMLASFLAGCQLSGGGKTPPAKKGPRGTKPYTIKGKTYHPLTSAHGFTENGIASWYGRDFHGKTTANGERYNMHGMTAAHKLLPFDTQVRVTNKNNGKSITVRINDRGPFIDSRVIDLTKTGAEKLGMLGPGTAPVRLEAIGTVGGMKEDGNIVGKFYVQIGAFSLRSNADGLVAKIKASGQNARSVYSDNQQLWRVQVGPYPSMFDADKGSALLRTTYQHTFVIAE